MSFAVDVGTEVSCPKCAKVMVRCVRRPVVGEMEWDSCFEQVGWKGQSGDPAICPGDGCEFYLPGAGVWVTGTGWTW